MLEPGWWLSWTVKTTITLTSFLAGKTMKNHDLYEHMTDEAGRIMRDEAESNASTLERKKWKPSSRVSVGERAKRRLVKQGATLVRGAF
ncbi:hypothetical protein M8186_000989 [Escherichia coli]|nr:hypothetical protein [Escherichia coli]EFA9308168.1 hypothetical protein [Escherichia coli]EFB9855783.1 hypothetical protein [Escherichia coli]EFE1075332.1 hypothetical protein [Escherichia coli]EFK0202536.1 hypothetical protein [Escherichia coli]